MAEYLIQGDTLTAIANAIRGKTGDTATMTASDMAGLIEGLEIGGGVGEIVEVKQTYGSSSSSFSITWPKDTLPDFLVISATDDSTSNATTQKQLYLGVWWNAGGGKAHFGGKCRRLSAAGSTKWMYFLVATNSSASSEISPSAYTLSGGKITAGIPHAYVGAREYSIKGMYMN